MFRFNLIHFQNKFVFFPSMIKWFYYILFLLIFIPHLSFARFVNNLSKKSSGKSNNYWVLAINTIDTNTIKNNKKLIQDDKVKIKEISKTKKQPKPEKVEPAENALVPKRKPKRQRRPEGLERPPEIPRRNGN